MQSEQATSRCGSRSYRVDDLMENPHFATAVCDGAMELLAIHRTAPRIVRYVADLQKWLLSQATLALHFEHKLDPARPPATLSNLTKFLAENRIASRNTAISLLKEMAHYGLFTLIDGPDRRSKAMQASPYAEMLIRGWFDGHLRSLDEMDGGRRLGRSEADPTLLFRAQPLVARRLFHHPGWYNPPETIRIFVKSESGSNVLHDLMSRVPTQMRLEQRSWIGPLSARPLSQEYVISRSQLVRLLSGAQSLDLIGWELPAKGGNCWISETLVNDYRRWQAVKYSVISQVMDEVW